MLHSFKRPGKLKLIVVGLVIFAAIAYYFCLPTPLFDNNYATILNDREGNLLSAKIAEDGQWRFPEPDSIPEKFEQCILLFEDRYFYQHPGFNPFSLARALYHNIRKGEIVGGGSTLSMQLIRLSRKDRSRTYLEKFIEIVLATRLELKYSKTKILKLYATHAPFGGNIVGLETASWKYFNRPPSQLSWGESALLTVLPNSPGLIYPGRNQNILRKKRNRLIDLLLKHQIIDALSARLAKNEPLPGRPYRLNSSGRHLLSRCLKEGKEGTTIQSTVSAPLQQQVIDVLQNHYQAKLRGNGIHNAAALVADVNSGEVLAYVGNTNIVQSDQHGDEVDIIDASRSTGSILKPFLYAAMLDEGLLLPGQLIPDIPLILDGFAPQNFSLTYEGAVPADRALARSLNVPAVFMLKDFSYEKFHHFLQEIGMSTLHQAPSHYGLSLILGGAEAKLWDLASIYSSMARTLNNYFVYPEPFRYRVEDFRPLHYHKHQQATGVIKIKSAKISSAAIWHTFQAMSDVSRPAEESAWELYDASRKIAWKTGTSYGFRDAWAIGLTPEYLVAVWVGNADGEGRTGLTGADAAAPILFDLFDFLPATSWFKPPQSAMKQAVLCRKSGMIASDVCDPITTEWIPQSNRPAPVCSYHHLIHLHPEENFQVDSECAEVNQMRHQSWFVLPPVQEWYYRNNHAAYQTLPDFHPDCKPSEAYAAMELIYPKELTKIYIPQELSGERGEAVFKVAHRKPSATIFWHLDQTFLGETRRIHQMSVKPSPGLHQLTLVDDRGNSLDLDFTIVSP